jgi:molybdopterin synthase sulfur carrier subunit
MDETTPMATISLYYWAGAKAAAGVSMERFETDSVAAALEQARRSRTGDAHFDRVLRMSSVLVDGVVARADDLEGMRSGDVRVEILPPFAGGSGRIGEQTHESARRHVDLSHHPVARIAF